MTQTTLTEPTSVYRYYDHLDVLIYVDITSRGAARNGEHNKSKPWWRFVTRQEVEYFDGREQAHIREIELIGEYAPPFNVQHNPGHEAARGVYLAFTAAQRATVDSPDAQLRALDNLLPLRFMAEQVQGKAMFRTEVDHADIALRLDWSAPTRVIIDQDGTVGGRVLKVEARGPFAMIHLDLRNSVSRRDLVAEVRARSVKGPRRFNLKRIKSAAALQANR